MWPDIDTDIEIWEEVVDIKAIFFENACKWRQGKV